MEVVYPPEAAIVELTARADVCEDRGRAQADRVLANRPRDPVALFGLGLLALQGGAAAQAIPLFERAVAAKPDYFPAQLHLGKAAMALGRRDAAVKALKKAAQHAPKVPEALAEIASLFHDLGSHRDSVAAYRQALAVRPSDPGLWYNLAIVLADGGRGTDAIEAYRKSVTLAPGFASAWTNLGVLLRKQGNAADALECHRRAIAADPNQFRARFNYGVALAADGRSEEAVASFTCACGIDPFKADAFNNLGEALIKCGRYAEAIQALDRALALAPQHPAALTNLGLVHLRVGNLDEAVVALEGAVASDPSLWAGWCNLGRALREQGDLAGALRAARRAVSLAPDNIAALSDLVYTQKLACDWGGLAEHEARLIRAVWEGNGDVEPFHLLALGSTMADQLACARQTFKGQPRPSAPPVIARKPRTRMRVGYLSPDFRRHPVSALCAEALERHDPSRVDVIGYSCGPNDGSEMRRRLERAFPTFHDCQFASDDEIAERIRQDGVDILVDLSGGHTAHSRMPALKSRPAPIQVSFLGFPGTCGADFIDYVIADPIVAPLEEASNFSETLVHMPGCYQPNPSTRLVSAVPTRRQAGLPDAGPVFCAFHNTYKVAPGQFAAWMRVLTAEPEAVLWLVQTNEMVVDNLRREAAAHDVAPERLVFAPWTSEPDHLARLTLADVFLDAAPYNAHTTAAEAVWMGVPVVTVRGSTFASRVATSILTAVGVPELAVADLDAYVALALDLARTPERRAEYRRFLLEKGRASSLFDSAGYASALERAYAEMLAAAIEGRKTQPIIVGPP